MIADYCYVYKPLLILLGNYRATIKGKHFKEYLRNTPLPTNSKIIMSYHLSTKHVFDLHFVQNTHTHTGNNPVKGNMMTFVVLQKCCENKHLNAIGIVSSSGIIKGFGLILTSVA